MTDEELKQFALEEANRGLQLALNKFDIFDIPEGLSEDQEHTYWAYLHDSELEVVYVV